MRRACSEYLMPWKCWLKQPRSSLKSHNVTKDFKKVIICEYFRKRENSWLTSLSVLCKEVVMCLCGTHSAGLPLPPSPKTPTAPSDPA